MTASHPAAGSSRREDWRFPLALLVLSRLALFVFSAVVEPLVPPLEPGASALLRRPAWLGAWARWDAGWYLSIAERGYFFSEQGQSSVGFFPLFPLLIRLATWAGLHPVVGGWLVANLAFLAAGLLFWELARAKLGLDAARHAVLWLTVFPYAFFFSAVYAEPLLLLGAVGSFWAAERGRLRCAAAFGALAALARPTGFLLFFALLAYRPLRAWRPRDLLPLAAIPAMPMLFGAYLWWEFGTPLAFVTAHVSGWRVGSELSLWPALRDAFAVIQGGVKLKEARHVQALLEAALPLAFAAGVRPVFRRLGTPYGLYALLTLGIAVGFAGNAIGRHLAVVFPVFMLVGAWDRGRPAAHGLRLLSFTVQLLFVILFVSVRWVS